MSAPKFAFGDVVWMKGTKYKVTIISEPEYVLKGQFVQGTIERAFAKYEGWWYRHSGEVDSTFCHESHLRLIPDASEWSFTDIMEEIKSGSGVDA